MKRLLSLDVLRGFDMLFIMGGEQLIYAIAAALGYPEFKTHFGHVEWHGLNFMDTVFPLFLFMAGVSFPFSLAKSRELGRTTRQIVLKCLMRGAILILLGLVYAGLLRLDFAHQRIPSVLGSIGLSWTVAALLFLAFSTRVRLLVAAGILLATTLFFGLVSALDAAADAVRLSAEWHFGCYLDRVLLGAAHIYQPLYDPEGFAGVPCAIVTAMLGMFAGEIVRKGGTTATSQKTVRLILAGVLALGLGLLVSLVYPINKKLWSPSFSLVVGGYSYLIFALFYWLVDVKGCTRGTLFFKVIGMNSITIYMIQRLVPMWKVSENLFGGVAALFPEPTSAIVTRVAYVVTCWCLLYFLYRKKIFLKV